MLRALDTTEPLDRYLELRAEIERLQEELEALKPQITAALWDEPEQHTLYRGCEISLGERRYFDYSEHVSQLQEELRALKMLERANGTAKQSKHISFPVVKVLPKAA